MTLTIPLVLFGIFLASVVLIFVVIGVAGVSLAGLRRKNPYSTGSGVGYGITMLLVYFLAFVANVGWWGGWVSLVIWAVQTLA
jgi:hypothetical protein